MTTSIRFAPVGRSRRLAPQSLRRGAALICIALLMSSLGAACKSGGAGPKEGELAPDFVLPRLDGSVQKLSNFRGSVVLVNMWATWCPPCIAEMPVLNEIARAYESRGLVVLGVAGDDDSQDVLDFIEQDPLAFPVLLDPGGAVGTQYGITGYPETFLVDREGRLQRKFIGPLPEVDGKPAPEVIGAIDAVLGG